MASGLMHCAVIPVLAQAVRQVPSGKISRQFQGRSSDPVKPIARAVSLKARNPPGESRKSRPAALPARPRSLQTSQK